MAHFLIDFSSFCDQQWTSSLCSFALMENNLDVHSIDISYGAVWVMKNRGLTNIHHGDIRHFNKKAFDTIVFFGNNHGLFGDINSFAKFLSKSNSILKPTGQILIPSSIVKIPINSNENDSIYGINYLQLIAALQYKGKKSKSFRWFMAEPAYISSFMKSNGWIVDSTYLNNNKTCLLKLTKNKISL